MINIDSVLERMVASGTLTIEQVKKAKEQVSISGISVDKILIKQGLISEEDIANVVAEEFGVPFIDLRTYLIDPDTVKLIPEKLSREKKIIPIFKIGKALTVATSDPQDVTVIDQIRLKTGLDVEFALASESAIENAIEQFYGVGGSIDEVVRGVDKQIASLPEEASGVMLEELAQEAPVVKLVNMLIMEAVKERASDIHIEPQENTVRIRFRIDGVLHEISSLSKRMQPTIISRIKVISKLDIAEKRKPQDGRLRMHMENREIDVRVSTFPTVHGENIVLRILDKATVILELVQLGFSCDMLTNFEKLIKRPNGIILVTGPTGSGKTTTLYAAIETLNCEEKNIITIEDPVEFHLPSIRQSQINPKAGVTFATGLRSILRQDPDIIMVGEIRDSETADIAVQAALTGHLVFSTLHTNDAAGAVSRLQDMGVESFLISSSIIGILAQRLVRTICPKCKEPYEGVDENGRQAVFYKGKGCKFCKKTGFYGRLGIFELLVMNDKIRKLVMAKASSEDIKAAAQESGFKTLRQDGMLKVMSGVTTPDEVIRVTAEI